MLRSRRPRGRRGASIAVAEGGRRRGSREQGAGKRKGRRCQEQKGGQEGEAADDGGLEAEGCRGGRVRACLAADGRGGERPSHASGAWLQTPDVGKGAFPRRGSVENAGRMAAPAEVGRAQTTVLRPARPYHPQRAALEPSPCEREPTALYKSLLMLSNRQNPSPPPLPPLPPRPPSPPMQTFSPSTALPVASHRTELPPASPSVPTLNDSPYLPSSKCSSASSSAATAAALELDVLTAAGATTPLARKRTVTDSSGKVYPTRPGRGVLLGEPLTHTVTHEQITYIDFPDMDPEVRCRASCGREGAGGRSGRKPRKEASLRRRHSVLAAPFRLQPASLAPLS